MAQQIVSIDSEALEAAYRALTPAQQGFTEDLMASNTIIPVLDLTADAQGGTVPEILQTALAYGSQTAFDISNTTTTIANSPGFYRVFGAVSGRTPSSGVDNGSFTLTDGVTPKIIYSVEYFTNSSAQTDVVNVDFVVFLAAGQSLTGTTDTTQISIIGSVRQIADSTGNMINPSGFTPE